jgi:hypothetical protein
MPDKKDILWFKQQFNQQVGAKLAGTPFTLDMLTAIACQETGYIWRVLRKQGLSVGRILELCVGDTLDADRGRRAFPKTKADLLSRPNGAEMFAISHQALVDLAVFINDFKPAAKKAHKFCRGFGIFQNDLQFFLEEPDFFLQKRYADFDVCLNKCLGELRKAMKRIGWEHKTSLTDLEMAGVAIAYNTGRFNPSKGLKQGFFDGQKFYGEHFFDFLRLSKSVQLGANGHQPTGEPINGSAPIPPPTPVTATGKIYEVDVRSSPLRLRSEPQIDESNPNGNVIAFLPDGQLVQAVTDRKVGEFLEVETSLLGAHHRGFASARFLKPAPDVEDVPVLRPEPEPPSTGIVAVFMPRRAGTVTRRQDPASAHSLNEPGQPGRQSNTPDGLRAELAAIIDWLGVDKETNKRYWPREGRTFCNMYAHDYCHLAGVYLPRVWWSPGAIERLAQGEEVEAQLGRTIDEQRANDLYRWLRDFGLRFGWRRTGTLTKLQLEVNQGAIGVIVARRREDGKSGHIVPVVPETNEYQARRDAAGEVIAPLQSQAGATNFRYGPGRRDWWKGEQFAESAFWLHP